MQQIINLRTEQIGQEIELAGWIIHKRSSGKISFLEIRDGSGFIQVVAEKNILGEEKFNILSETGIESSIKITGILSSHPKTKEFELQLRNFVIITETKDYIISEKEHGIDFLLDNRHLWLRSKKQWAIQRIRNIIINATYDFSRENNFIKIDSPIFTPSACEGTTDLFKVEYVNGENVYLSQSGQLYLEAAIMAQGRVFDFEPVFRAEKSKTRRHLNEFWMMDAEMAFFEHKDNMIIQENLIYYIIQEVLKNGKNELKILERNLSALEKIQLPFERKTYDEIIEELQSMGSDIKAGDDLGGDDEEILMNKYSNPLFIEGYPAHVKAFYMKENPNKPGYVLNNDLLAPEGYGEIIGGSERESSAEILEKKILEHGLNVKDFQWYLDIRKNGGVPHSGFGYGLERIVRWLCGIHHVRETIPFPRTLNRISP